MTVSSETNKLVYAGDGADVTFNYTWKIFDQDDILVQVVDADDVITTQTITTHYSVSGVGTDAGGVVTFVTAPAATESVILSRTQPMTQDSDYIENTTIPNQTHEDALDKIWMAIQEADEKIGRAPKFQIHETTFDGDAVDFPKLDGNTGLFLKVNTAEDGLEWARDSFTASELDFDDLTTLTALTLALDDEQLVWDKSASLVKKMTITQLITELQNLASFGDLISDLTPVLGGDLDVGGFSVVSSTAGDIAITPDTTGNIILDGLKWPQADGTANYILKTDGAGQLSWTAAASGTPGGSTTQIQYNNAGAFGGDSGFTTDGAGSVNITGDLDVDNINLNGNTISATGAITVTPSGTNNITLGTMTLDADQSIGAGQDNYVLTYDNAGGLISLEAATGGGGGDCTLISTSTASASATIDITLSGGYEHYMLVLNKIAPATDAVTFSMLVSDDNAVSFEVTNYTYHLADLVNGSWADFSTTTVSTGTEFRLHSHVGGLGSATGEFYSGIVHIFANGTGYPSFLCDAHVRKSDSQVVRIAGAGSHFAGNSITDVRFSMSSGNIASGDFRLYGFSNS